MFNLFLKYSFPHPSIWFIYLFREPTQLFNFTIFIFTHSFFRNPPTNLFLQGLFILVPPTNLFLQDIFFYF